MPKIDIHNFKRRLELVELAIRSGEIPGKDQRSIWEFRDQCFADGLSYARVTKYMHELKGLYNHGLCSIPGARPADIIRILASIEREELSGWTKHDYRLALRKYLAFSGRQDLAALVKLPNCGTHKLPEELLTIEDILELMAKSHGAMDRVLLITLWETGCRVGELLGIRRKHVRMDSIGAVIIVEGKTGMRRVRVIEAALILDEWISEGSFQQDEPIFPISYAAFRKRLQVLAARAGIDKRIYPHLFRHSRATFLASYLTEAQLCAYHGWTVGSSMPRIYVHLNSKDLDSTLMNVPAVLAAPRNHGAILAA
jgi:integrase/recombinase XerD